MWARVTCHLTAPFLNGTCLGERSIGIHEASGVGQVLFWDMCVALSVLLYFYHIIYYVEFKIAEERTSYTLKWK